jgi:hypothetical protein
MGEDRQTRRERRAEAVRERRRGPGDRAHQQRRQWLLTRLAIGGVGLLILAGLAYVVISAFQERGRRQAPEGVQTFENLAREHTQEPVEYEQIPPVGGVHAPIWQNCGFYSAPINDENAVHSMEHGAVWIAYQSNLPEEQVQVLREIAEDEDFVLVSPYPDLPAPVVASAWERQLSLETADDPDLEQFVSAFQQGPQTPEPGASCSGGVSTTQ